LYAKLIAFLRLIRFGNLLIMALTQIAVRYGIINPLYTLGTKQLRANGFEYINPKLALSGIDFAILIITTLLIAAAGYIINDYFDVKADRINRPTKLVIGKGISRRKGIIAHITLSTLGMFGGIYLAWKVDAWSLAFIQLFSITALWFYSTHFKKQMLVGNLIIASLATLVPLTVGIYELKAGAIVYMNQMNMLIPESGTDLLLYITIMVIGFSAFAFASNLVREIIKDMEDLEGDAIDGRKTLPYVVGIQTTRIFTLFLLLSMMLFLLFIQQKMLIFDLTGFLYYTVFGVQLPLLAIIMLVWQAKTKEQFSNASAFCKVLILSGVISMFFFGFFLNN